MKEQQKNQYLILFDGVCNLCNSSVNFIIKHDKKNKFVFAPLQSDIAKIKAEGIGFDYSKMNSIILIIGGKAYSKSTAVLFISKNLSGLYPLFFCFIIIPRIIRDMIYDYIAKNRYKWFGKKEVCMIPTQELKSKFIS